MRRARLAAKIGMTIFVGTLLTEGALRSIGVGDPVILQPDPQCEYFPEPNQSHYRFFVHTHMNRFGMRSEDFAMPKPAGTERLMFVGDSISYGTTQVDQSNLFTDILRRELPAILHRSVDVLNASASGWGPANELGFLKSRGTFDSSTVVLVLNNGDLSQRRSTAGDVGNSLFFSKPACAICEVAHHYGGRPRQDLGVTETANNAQEEANLKALDDFHEIVAASGAKMLVFFVPFRVAITSNRPSLIQPKLVNWAASRGVAIVDATPRLAKMTVKDATLDGAHLSIAGNRTVADTFEWQANEIAALGSARDAQPAQPLR